MGFNKPKFLALFYIKNFQNFEKSPNFIIFSLYRKTFKNPDFRLTVIAEK